MVSIETPARFRTRASEAAVVLDVGAVDEALWTRFAASHGTVAFIDTWLAVQARLIRGVRAGMVLAQTVDGQAFAPAAVWPTRDTDCGYLRAAAEEALSEARGIAKSVAAEPSGRPAATHIAYPVEAGGQVLALVVLDLDAAEPIQPALRTLHWGVGWLEAEVWHARSREGQDRLDRSAFALDVLAIASEHVALEAAAMATTNALATRMALSRASIGLVTRTRRSGRIRLTAMSHTAWFKRRTALVLDLENAMEEALDQNRTLAAPAIDGVDRGIEVAHRSYAEDRQAGSVVSVILVHRAAPIGVLTLERREGAFTRAEVATAEAVAALLGPLLDLKRLHRRWFSGRLPDLIGDGLKAVFGPRRPSFKLAALIGAGALAYVALAPGLFQVSGQAVVEGLQQRAAVAPFEGFVATAPIRAGDLVKAGDVMAELDDKDLRLEVERWRSEYAQLLQQKRKAMAQLERSEVALLDAQLEQARAQLELTTAKLERTRITAPIDGFVISGDLSQKLGTPVERGTVLFEVAPLADFRVAVRVDERDIAQLKVGQTGRLLLTGRTQDPLPVVVTAMTSVASVADGRNVFRVEARLTQQAEAVRPGMEGVARIDIEDRSILWIWTRRLMDWIRITLWRWTP